jgi:hypothetical protein
VTLGDGDLRKPGNPCAGCASTRRLIAAMARVHAICSLLGMPRISAVVVSLAFVSMPAVAHARDLWVDHDSKGGPCDDARSADTVSVTAPWCTLAQAGRSVAPGDTVTVRGGVYTELADCGSCDGNAVLQLVTPGTQTSPIVFQSYPGEDVVLQGGAPGVSHGLSIKYLAPGFVTVDGFHVRDFPVDCLHVIDSTDVTLLHLDLTGCAGGAAELHGTQRVTLAYSQIHDNKLGGFTSAIDLYLCKDQNVIRGNRVWANQDVDSHQTEGHGLTMDTCGAAGGALVEDNVIWDNDGWCLSVYESDGADLRNNTCWQNGARGDGSGEITVLGNAAEVWNNVLVSRDGAPGLVLRYDESSYAVDPGTIDENANLVWSASHDDVFGWGGATGTLADYQSQNGRGWGSTDLSSDPMWVDAASADFHLTSGSPAVDTGDDAHASAVDADGFQRPFGAHVDRGAYELGASTPGDAGGPPPPTPGDDAGFLPGDDAGAPGGGGCACDAVGSRARGASERGPFAAVILLIPLPRLLSKRKRTTPIAGA